MSLSVFSMFKKQMMTVTESGSANKKTVCKPEVDQAGRVNQNNEGGSGDEGRGAAAVYHSRQV